MAGSVQYVIVLTHPSGELLEKKITFDSPNSLNVENLKEQLNYKHIVTEHIQSSPAHIHYVVSDYIIQIWSVGLNRFKTVKTDKDVHELRPSAQVKIIHKSMKSNTLTRKNTKKDKKTPTPLSLSGSSSPNMSNLMRTPRASSFGNATSPPISPSSSTSSLNSSGSFNISPTTSSSLFGISPSSAPSTPPTNNMLRDSRELNYSSSPNSSSSGVQMLFQKDRAKTVHKRNASSGMAQGSIRKWKGPMFGIPLHDVIERQLTGTSVPQVVLETTDWLRERGAIKEEGIFRVSGASADIDELRKEYDKKGSLDLFAEKRNIHVIAGLLKLFYRELPEPVLIYRYYSTIIKVAKNPDVAARKNSLKLIIQKLPKANKDLLLFTIQFLKEVSTYSSQNKMHVTNLAVVWGPNILRDSPDEGNFQSQLLDAEAVNIVVSLLIEDSEYFSSPMEDADYDNQGHVITTPPMSPSMSKSGSYSFVAMSTTTEQQPQSTTNQPAAGGVIMTGKTSQLERKHGELTLRRARLERRKLELQQELTKPANQRKTSAADLPPNSPLKAKYEYKSQNITMSNGDKDVSVKKGDLVTLIEVCPGGTWLKVQLVNGSIGCLPATYLMKADDPSKPNNSTDPAGVHNNNRYSLMKSQSRETTNKSVVPANNNNTTIINNNSNNNKEGEWREAIDARGKVYYYNTVTKKTSWKKPTADNEDENLPPDWKSHISSGGKKYYYNTVTKVTSWVKPTANIREETEPDSSVQKEYEKLLDSEEKVLEIEERLLEISRSMEHETVDDTKKKTLIEEEVKLKEEQVAVMQQRQELAANFGGGNSSSGSGSNNNDDNNYQKPLPLPPVSALIALSLAVLPPPLPSLSDLAISDYLLEDVELPPPPEI